MGWPNQEDARGSGLLANGRPKPRAKADDQHGGWPRMKIHNEVDSEEDEAMCRFNRYILFGAGKITPEEAKRLAINDTVRSRCGPRLPTPPRVPPLPKEHARQTTRKVNASRNLSTGSEEEEEEEEKAMQDEEGLVMYVRKPKLIKRRPATKVGGRHRK